MSLLGHLPTSKQPEYLNYPMFYSANVFHYGMLHCKVSKAYRQVISYKSQVDFIYNFEPMKSIYDLAQSAHLYYHINELTPYEIVIAVIGSKYSTLNQ